MIIQFKNASPVTLGDDLAQVLAGVRWTVELETWGLQCKVQEEDLPEPNGGVPFLAPLGNVRGPFQFVAKRSFATLPDGAIDFATIRLPLVNLQDSLVIYPYGNTAGNVKVTFANSVCQQVYRVPGKSNGVLWAIRYAFHVGQMTAVVL